MQELELTFERLLRIWWLFAWRAIVVGGVSGFVAGALLGAIAGLTGHLDQAAVWGRIAGFVVSVPAGFFVLRMALLKRYSDFRIALVTRESS